MGKEKTKIQVKLFCGIMYKSNKVLKNVIHILSETYGEIEDEINYGFSEYTNHYEEEMGQSIEKKIVSFKELVSPENIYQVKKKTNEIEKCFSIDGKRQINLDPGYLTLAKVILLTTKNYSHRIYLTDGIFAEITLTFRKSTYTTNPWTYPDYKAKDVIDFMMNVRKKYRKQIDRYLQNKN